MVLLSVVVPIYNVEEYLDECLSSILSNINLERFEVILVNDCSTDSSRNIAQSFVNKAPNLFKLIDHKKNRGLSAARNSGTPYCHGKYLTYVDSDDWLAKGAIDEIIALLDKESPDLLMFDHELIYDDRTEYIRFDPTQKKYTFIEPSEMSNTLIKMSLNAWSKVYLTPKFIDNYSFPEGVVFEDMAVIPAVVASCQRILYLPKPFYKYRQRAGSLMSNYTSKPEIIFPSLVSLHRYYKETHQIAFEFITIRALIIYQPRALVTPNGENSHALSVLKTNIKWMHEHYPGWAKNPCLKSTTKGKVLSSILVFVDWPLARLLFLFAVSYDKVIVGLKNKF